MSAPTFCSPKALSSSARSSVTDEDLSMDHVIDLDQAAAQITARTLPRLDRVRAQPRTGHVAGEAAPLPQPLVALLVETRATYR